MTLDLPAPVADLLARAETMRRAGDISAAIDLGVNALAKALESSEPLSAALVRLELANFHRYLPAPREALLLLSDAEPTLRSVRHAQWPRLLTVQGMILADLGEHHKALDLYREALALAEQRGVELLPTTAAVLHGALGLTFTQLNDFTQAEAAYRQSLTAYTHLGNQEGLAYVLNNLAILRVRRIQATEGASIDPALAQELFSLIDDGLVSADAAGSRHARALLLSTRGDGLRALGDGAAALQALDAALAAYRELGSARGESDALTDRGAALLALGRLEEAREDLTQALKFACDHGLSDQERRLQRLLSEAHERLGNATAALACFKAYHRLERDRLDSEAQRKIQQIALREELARLERKALEDALTGMPNRRQVDIWLKDWQERGVQTLAVSMIDIDHFKRINDNFSHQTGDEVLREVGRIMLAHCRTTDRVARWGGEEFLLLQINVNADQASASCERLRRKIETEDWGSLHPELNVTASLGIAHGRIEDFSALQASADAALYTAKRNGRNQTVLADAARAT